MRRAVPLSLPLLLVGACGGDEPHYTKGATDPCLERLGERHSGLFHADAVGASIVELGQGKTVHLLFWSSAEVAQRQSERDEAIPGSVNEQKGNVSLSGRQERVGASSVTDEEMDKVGDCLG